VLDSFVKVVFYLCAGLALFGALVWYIGSAYEALTGRGAVVIPPLTVAGPHNAETDGRGEALARMLQTRLQQIEHDLVASQDLLVRGRDAVTPSGVPGPQSSQGGTLTAIAPTLIATQGVALQTRLLEPTKIKVEVGGVDVGGMIPWLQRLLVTRRTLEFTLYETDHSVIVTGSLQALGVTNQALRVEVSNEQGKPPNLDSVASLVAMEIEHRRLARDPTNRVEVLSTEEFGTLISVLSATARLNRQTALGRPARTQFEALLEKIEPLASEVRDWYQLQLLAASLAESADRSDKAVGHLRNAKDAMNAQLTAATSNRAELETWIADVAARINRMQPDATKIVAKTAGDAKTSIEADARNATGAFNKLFGVQLKPLPVELLDRYAANAYSDGKKFFAPPAVAQLPEITWHDMTWQYIGLFVPVFDQASKESQAVSYSYSDVLPLLIRQLGMIDSADANSWDAYPGAVAWITASIQKREFILGSDRRPLRSFKNPGTAYADPVIGNDPQIANYSDLKPDMEVHAASGVGNKAFYEVAQRVGVERAGKIWISALHCIKGRALVNYRTWAACLLEVSEGEQPQVREALQAVGLVEGKTGKSKK